MALSRDHVGTRVVVRMRVRGEMGPSGGPAYRDVLGVMTAWGPDAITVERRDGVVETLRHDEVETGKPIPPRASVRQRVPAAELERVCALGWQPIESARVGEWLLRAAGGFTGRANSALVAGDPGAPVDQAIAELEEFYRRHGLPTMAQAVVGSDEEAMLVDRGWTTARPGEPDPIVQVASVAMARRRRLPANDVTVDLRDEPSDEWIARYHRTDGVDPDVVRRVLTGGAHVAFASVGDSALGDSGAAIGRGVVTGDWVGLSAVEVSPDRRRQGLGSAIVSELLEWAASLGARSTYLQTFPDNVEALALYEPYGFVAHHSYRYLRPRQTTSGTTS